MSKFSFGGINFDSQEEIDFYHFLIEAEDYGFVHDIEYQPESFELIPGAYYETKKVFKTKPPVYETKTLYHPHTYTADFKFSINRKLFDDLRHNLKCNDNSIIVDIKGKYNLHGGDRIFPIHQKLLYYRYGLHVNKLIPDTFFSKIDIVPEAIRYMKNRKSPTLKKAYQNISTFNDRYGYLKK